MTCSVDDCAKTAKKAGLCWAHHKRRQRRKPLSEPLRQYDPWDTLMAAVRAWSASDNDEDFARMAKDGRSRVEERIRKAAIRYAQASRHPEHRPALEIVIRTVTD